MGVIPVELCTDEETSEDELYKWGHLVDSTDVEDEDGPIKEFDVDVTYSDKDGFLIPLKAEIIFYTLTMVEEEDA